MRQAFPLDVHPDAIAVLDQAVWQRGLRVVAVLGASKNAGKTTALRALACAAGNRHQRVGLCSVGVDGEASDAWLATAKPQVWVPAGALVVTAADVLTAGAWKILQPLPTASSLGPVVLAEARQPGTVLLCGLRHRRHLSEALQALRAAGADRILVDGAYHRQAAADAPEVEGLVLAVGAIVPLAQAEPTLCALATATGPVPPLVLDVRGGLTDARLAGLDWRAAQALRVAGQGAVLLSAVAHQQLRRHGVRVLARSAKPLLAVTCNPSQPDRGSAVPAAVFLAAVRDWLHKHGVRVVVVDAVAGLSSLPESP